MLERFGPATQDWFRGAFAAPTDAQVGAWEAISHGKHALVVAPTGSGKTLSAFLWAIDRVFHEKDAAAACRRGQAATQDGCRGIPHPHPLHLAAQGARRRRRAQPPLAARRDRAVRAAPRHRGARRHGRRALGRHDLERPAQARHGSARHPHHDARVALPDAHEPGRRDAQERAHGHRRRGARRRRDQARRAPRGEPRAARRAPRSKRRPPAHRAVGDGAADRRGRALPRRVGARRDRRAAGDEGVRHDASIVPVDDMLNPPPPPGADVSSEVPTGCRGRRAGRRGLVRRRRQLGRRPETHRDDRVGVAARRGGDRRPHRAAPLDDRVLQLAAPRRAADRPAQRDLLRAARARPARCRGPGRDDGPGRAHARAPTRCSRRPTTARSRRSSARRSRRS